MSIISYAQNREDVLLNRVFPGPAGFYIDVGAALPVDMSVTKLFYDRGWSGVNVEPLDRFFDLLAANRPRDVNLKAVVSATSGTLTLFEAPTQEGMTTANPDAARELEAAGHQIARREVPALTLAEVCERHVAGEIDFLKIDAEGEERNVLLGADFTRWRPRVLVIEATEAGRPTPNHHLWEDVVLAADYTFATFDGLNRYYVRAGDEGLIPTLQVPVSVFDDFVPYEQERWRIAAERNETNLRAVHAEGELVRAAYDKLDAEHKELWHSRQELWDKYADTFHQLEAAERRAAAAERRAADAIERYQAARDRVCGVRRTLARLRDGTDG